MSRSTRQNKRPPWWPTAAQKARADAEPESEWGRKDRERREARQRWMEEHGPR